MADDKKKKAGAKQPAPKQAKKPAKGAKGEANTAETAAARPVRDPSTEERVPPRRRQQYRDAGIAALTKQFSYKNAMQVPRLQKIVVNVGLGAAVQNPKLVDSAVEEVTAITGQKPVVTRAKKAIASFKLREGVPIGVMVTLRRERMWEFLDRLISVALPRVRDFKGVSPRGFDGQGNYTLGLREQIIFPEIEYDKIDVIKGLNVSFVTTATTDEEGRALLKQLGMPFRA